MKLRHEDLRWCLRLLPKPGQRWWEYCKWI